MADPEAKPLIDEGAVRRALGLPESGNDPDLTAAMEAATAYVVRYHGELEVWPADYRLGAVKLATGLHRDALTPGISEPFNTGNVYKRATDVEIEQLLRIGRFALPGIG